MHVMYICLIVTIVKALCKQYIKHFSYQDLLNIFDKLLPDELNDSFKVITKKKKKKKKKWAVNYLAVCIIDWTKLFRKSRNFDELL